MDMNTQDIEVLNECKELRRKLEESKIEYNGERLTITEISRKARSK